MPDLGDKVGDVYVEVHAEMDKRALASTEAQLNKYASRVQRDLNKKLGTDFTKQIDATLKAAGKSEFAAQNRTIQSLQRQREQAIRQNEKAQVDSQKRIFSRTRSLNEQVQRDHLAAIREDLARTKRVEEEKTKIIQKHAKRRYKDGGSPGIGEAFENAISILPGQLEKLFRNPAIAATLITAGVALAGFVAQGLAAGLSLAAGGGVLIGAVVALVKNDAEVANAFKGMGDRAMSAFLDQAVKFKPQIIDLFHSLGSDINDFIRGLDFSQIIGSIGPIRDGLSDTLAKLQPGIQALVDLSGPLLRDLFQTVLPGIATAFTDMAQTFKQNGGYIRDALGIIGMAVEVALKAVGGLVKLGTFTMKVIEGIEVTMAQYFSKLAGGWNAIADKIPGLGGAKIDTAPFDEFVNGIVQHRAKMDDFSYTLGDVGTSLTGIADDSLKAAGSAKTLAEQQTILADAYQTAFDKQQQADQGLRTGLSTQQTWTTTQKRIRDLLKENGRTLDQNTTKGVDNAKGLEQAFRDLKDTYRDDVKEGRISADKAKTQFRDRAKALLANFDKNSPAYKTMTDFINHLDDFPKEKKIDISVTGYAVAKANIDALKSDLAGLGSAADKKRAANQLEKNKASGGMVSGPGTGTSDSIPANLSNGEFVIKASSAKSIGYGNLSRMNSSGRMMSHFATGGAAGTKIKGNGRGATAGEKKAYEALLRQIAMLNKTITVQTKAMERYNEQLQASKDQFKSFVNLGALSTEGKKTGDILQELQQRKAKAGTFQRNLASLKAKGLSGAALQQIADAGPDSDIAKLVLGGSKYDIGLINSLLGGSDAYAKGITNTLQPGGARNKKALGYTKKILGNAQKKAKKLRPVKATGATISYAGGKTTALFSAKELQNQQLKAGTYVTVMIDGKEVRALVKEEQHKTVKKSNRQMKSGRK